jgi:MSHA biogenesis protein MshL
MRNHQPNWPGAIVIACVLGACATTPGAYDKPKDTIKTALSEAVADAGKPAAADKEADRSLYPSMRLDMPAFVAEALEPRFDLVVNKASVRDVLLSMVADTRYSMLLPEDLSGTVTVNLKAVTVPEALSALRQLAGFEYRMEGSRVYIQSQTLQTRIMKVDYLNAVRRGNSDIRVISGSVSDTGSGGSAAGATGTSGASGNQNAFVMSKISTTVQSDFWAEMTEALKAILGNREGRSVVISPQSGVLVVRALPGELSQIEAFLRASQVALEKQVIIEAKVIEVALNNSFQAGINWAVMGAGRLSGGPVSANGAYSVGQVRAGTSVDKYGVMTSAPISGTPGQTLANAADAAGAMFGMVLRSGNFAAVINLLEEQGKVHVLSSPRVATLNNQKALLKVGSDDFFVTEVSTNSSTGANGSQNVTPKLTLQPFFSGIVLDVTPQIDANDQITLHIHPMISKVRTVNQQIDLGTLGSFRLPLASSEISEMDSVVKAQDGQMVALGGLIRQGLANADSQVPVLGSLPLIGGLFKQKSQEVERRELVILLKPTVIQSSADWADDISRSEGQIKRLLDIDNNSFFGHDEQGRKRGGKEK